MKYFKGEIELKGTYEIKFYDDYFYIYDENGNWIYHEESDGYWAKWEFDDNGNQIYFENSGGVWEKREYDENGKQNYYENSKGYLEKREYDENGNLIYCEHSNGVIIDKRLKKKVVIELTQKQLDKVEKILKDV